jgi:hypothetical protein
VEISCPDDCVYLATAREHPPAAVQRQHQADVRFLAQSARQLSESQHQILFLLEMVVRKHASEIVPSINDQDIADAAGALASTLESAARGIIYEHQPASLPAQRLVRELDALVRELVKQAPRADRDAAVALRALERCAKAARAELEGGDRALLRLIERLLGRSAVGAGDSGARPAAPPEPPRLIIP